MYKHLLHFSFNRELSEAYITSVIRSFALALIGVFIPAYLIKLGYPIIDVFYFYLYWAICFFILVIFVNILYVKFGIKHAMLFSMPLCIIHFLLLYSLEFHSWNLFFVAFTGAFGAALYWPAFHIDFIKCSDKKHRGEEVSMLNAFSYVATIFAPLIGGLIIAFLGFKFLFGFVSFLFLIAPIPLFFTKEVYPPLGFSFKHLLHKNNLKNFSVFFVEGIINYTETVIWVVFIYMILKSFISLGFLSTVVVLFTTFITFVLGRISDIVNKRKIMNLGVLSSSIIWFFRSLANSFFHFTILNSLFGIAFTFLSIPYMALFYDKAAKKHPAEFVVFREAALTLGRIAIILFIILTGSFVGSFIITGISSLVFAFF